jgi:hypothetical protein
MESILSESPSMVASSVAMAPLRSASGGFAGKWLQARAKLSKMDGFGTAQLGYGLAAALLQIRKYRTKSTRTRKSDLIN